MSETNAARGYEKPQNDFGGKFAFYANFMTKSMCFILREVRSSEFTTNIIANNFFIYLCNYIKFCNMVNRLFTTKANKFSSFAPALKGVKKINLLPLGWGEQIDFHTMNISLVNKRLNIYVISFFRMIYKSTKKTASIMRRPLCFIQYWLITSLSSDKRIP